MTLSRLTLAFSLQIFAACLITAATPPETNSALPHLEFEKYTLPNGLQVILHVDRKLPMVHINSWYHVGSKNERVGRTGFAHLFEHMMFEGSKDANAKYFTFIEKAGANLFEGGVNGTTNEDRTNYFVTLPAANLEYALWIESDRLATLTDVLTKAKLDSERDIVKNERRQGVENQPYGRAWVLLNETVFPAGHPYSHSVIGSHEDLTAASVDDVKDFFHTYYTPNNLSLAITGDFDIAKTKQLIAKYFGPIPPGPPLDRPAHWVPVLSGEKIVEIRDHVPQERVYFAWPTPAFFEPGDAALDLTASMLTDGLSARLNKSLVYDKQLCSNIFSNESSNEIASTFFIAATARPGVSLSLVEQNITAEIARLAKEGPTEAELNRSKAKWELQYVSGLERIGGFGGQADMLNQYNTFLGDPDKFGADVERHRAVTREDLRLAADKWLNTNNRVLLRFHPENAVAAPATVTSLDRSEVPAFGADVPFHAPTVQSAKLENGLSVFVVERKDLPKVVVDFATRAGSVDDPVGREGLASLASLVMARGTRSKNALEIDDSLGDIGTSLSSYADRERSSLSVEVLSKDVPRAMSIIADVAQHPSFPQDETERERKKRLDSLAQAENQPNAISYRLTSLIAFGKDHPYGHPTQGYRSTVESITPQELMQFHSKYWKAGSSSLTFVGDISLEKAVSLGKEFFGSWAPGEAPQVKIGPPAPLGLGKVFLINHSDAAQTVVTEILPAPIHQAADFYPLTLADTVWGGGAGARLGSNIREDKGYSYGVFSFVESFSTAGLWTASGGVQTDKTKEALVEFQKELHFIAGEKPVSEKELTAAKDARIRGYAQKFESMGRVAGQVEELWGLGLPMSELERAPQELQQATLSSVNGAAEKYATPSRTTLLLVGDLSKIEKGVRDLNLGEVIILDAEGKPVKK